MPTWRINIPKFVHVMPGESDLASPLDARSDRASIYISCGVASYFPVRLPYCLGVVEGDRGRSRSAFSLIAGMELSAEGADKLQVVVISDTKLDAIALVNVTRGHSVGAKRYFGASLLCFYRGLGKQVRPVNCDVSINRVIL
jgi:hypothetical protein